MAITKPTKKKVKVSTTGRVSVLYSLPYDEVSIFKDICKKRKVSCSEQVAHLIIKFIAEDCISD